MSDLGQKILAGLKGFVGKLDAREEKRMKTYEFTIELLGVAGDLGDIANLLYAKCDDVTASFGYGRAQLVFDRKADSLRLAVISALFDVMGVADCRNILIGTEDDQ